MMLETLWPPGRQKNNGMGYFYGGAKQWATSRWDAGAWPDAPLSDSVPPRQPLPLPQREKTEWLGGWVGWRGVETSATLRITEDLKIQVDNKIFAWGNGTSGQLGDRNKTVKDHAVEVKLPQDLNAEGSHINSVVVGVACGSRHSFIWTETGLAYGFGNNFYAQLGYDFQRADFKEHQDNDIVTFSGF
eukprot:superscaffoldBa00000642_g6244